MDDTNKKSPPSSSSSGGGGDNNDNNNKNNNNNNKNSNPQHVTSTKNTPSASTTTPLLPQCKNNTDLSFPSNKKRTCYETISRSDVKSSLETLRAMYQIEQTSWDEECSYYEQEQQSSSERAAAAASPPRELIYPYSPLLLPLQNWIPDDSSSSSSDGSSSSSGSDATFCDSSPPAPIVYYCLLPPHRLPSIDPPNDRNDYAFIPRWEALLLSDPPRDENHHDDDSLGFSTLLRLFRHCTSEISRDFHLARILLLRIWDGGYLLSVDNFAQFLVTLRLTYYFNCFGTCRDEEEEEDDETGPDHCCGALRRFYGTLVHCLSTLPSFPLVRCGFILWEYDDASAAAACMETAYESLSETTCVPADRAIVAAEGASDNRHKVYIKQKLFYGQHTHDDDDNAKRKEPFRVTLVRSLVQSLGLSCSRKDDPDRWDGIAALVDIGEASLRRLPNNPLMLEVGGDLVRALLTAHVGVMDEDCGSLVTLLCPTRYARTILRPSEEDVVPPVEDVRDVVRGLFLRRLVDLRVSQCGYGDWLVWTGCVVTPEDALIWDYESNYVDFEDESDSSSSSSEEDSDDDSDDDDEKGFLKWNYTDEANNLLVGYTLMSRYDLTLSLLYYAYHNTPWSLSSHHSYPPTHRAALSTLAHITHHHSIPPEVNTHINSFIPRSFFSNSQQPQCWKYDCQLKRLGYQLKEKILSRVTTTTTTDTSTAISKLKKRRKMPDTNVCDCGVAYWCDNDGCCKKHGMQDGHRKFCNFVPYTSRNDVVWLMKDLRRMGLEDDVLDEMFERLFREVECGDNGMILENEEENVMCSTGRDDERRDNGNDGGETNEGDDDDDDESCWESVNSDEEDDDDEEQDLTDVIYAFYYDRSYKFLNTEEPAFAQIYRNAD